MADNYARRGVSSGKADVHFAIEKLDKGLYPNAFCKVLPDTVAGDPDYCTIMHADGAGTKSSLAYLYWKETGDLSVWRGIVQDGIVMNLDDMLCAGATDHFLFSNTIGRNKFLVPREVLAEMVNGMEDFLGMLGKYGISAASTGGETADVGDLVRTLIFDATAFSRFPKKQVITNEKIAAGQVIVGLASYGKASFESTYNSGIGSNGLTNARHDVLSHIYAEKYPETYDPAVSRDLIYSGKYLLTDAFEGAPLSVGQLLLSPTRTYLPLMKPLLENFHDKIYGLIHCTGGGQTKVMKFVNHLHVIKDHLLPVPPVFKLIQEASGTPWQDMYPVFNMGHRLEIYTDAATAPLLIEQAQKMGIEAQVVGRCEASDENRLTLETPYGTFHY